MQIRGTCISSIEDAHGTIYVYETRTSRILSFDDTIYQSSMKLNDIEGLTLDYTQGMMAGLLFIPSVKTATIMGLGAGSMAKNLLNSFSNLNIHAVENREAVVAIAKEYFYLPETDRLSIHIDDAAHYIKNTHLKSDIIFSDLYNSKGMELKQIKKTYLHDCKDGLNEHGVLVLNIWHTDDSLREEFNQTLSIEFDNQILRFTVESGNTIILAFKNKIPTLKTEELLAKGIELQEIMNIPMERYAKLLVDKLQQ